VTTPSFVFQPITSTEFERTVRVGHSLLHYSLTCLLTAKPYLHWYLYIAISLTTVSFLVLKYSLRAFLGSFLLVLGSYYFFFHFFKYGLRLLNLIFQDDWSKTKSLNTFTVKTKLRFGECYTCFSCETKKGMVRIFVILQDIICSGISLKRSRRELSIDVAEHRSMLKNYQNTHNPRLSFKPKTGTIPQNGFLFFTVLFL